MLSGMILCKSISWYNNVLGLLDSQSTELLIYVLLPWCPCRQSINDAYQAEQNKNLIQQTFEVF